MPNCVPHIREGKGIVIATRLVPVGNGTKEPMCNEHWQRFLTSATEDRRDAIGNAPAVPVVPGLPEESVQKQTSPTEQPRLCRCGCGEALRPDGYFSYVKGHKARPPVKGSHSPGDGAMQRAIAAIDAEIQLLERRKADLHLARQTLLRLTD